jgi:hypothetical protein
MTKICAIGPLVVLISWFIVSSKRAGLYLTSVKVLIVFIHSFVVKNKKKVFEEGMNGSYR